MNLENYIYEFTTIAIAHFLALLSPGPDFFVIIRNSVRHSFKSGVFTSVGIALANGVYIFLAFIGTNFIKENSILFLIAKILGGSFLIYLGYNLLKAKPQELYKTTQKIQEIPTTNFKSLSVGFLSAFLNPKNYIAYFSFYAVMVSPTTPALASGIYGLWMFLAVLFWDIFVAFSVGNKRVKTYLSKHTNKLEKISGGFISLIGVTIIYELLPL